MAYIEMQQLPVIGATSENIFTTHLELDPIIINTMIRNIKEGGDKQNRQSNVQAIMTNWAMQKEPGFVELEKEITDVINYIPNILEIVDYTFNSPMEWGFLSSHTY